MAVTIDGTSGINTPGVVNTAAETIATTLAVTGAATLSSTLAVTGVTTFAAGTAALPAITTTGDTNTGIFFPAADTIGFSEGGAECARFDSSGNFGLGVTPAAKLDVLGDVFARASTLRFKDSGNTTQYAAIYGDATTFNINAGVNNLLLFSAGTERARINSSGNLLVGKTTTAFGTVGANIEADGGVALTKTHGDSGGAALYLNRLNVNGAVALFYKATTEVGNISVTGSATTYNTSSDYRLKNTIAPMTGALDKVALLKPCTYKWNVDGSDGQGFIAHELDEVVAGCVTGEKDAVETYTDEEGNEATRPKYQGIDTSFLVATLTAAIQEQQALITALTTRITALEAA